MLVDAQADKATKKAPHCAATRWQSAIPLSSDFILHQEPTLVLWAKDAPCIRRRRLRHELVGVSRWISCFKSGLVAMHFATFSRSIWLPVATPRCDGKLREMARYPIHIQSSNVAISLNIWCLLCLCFGPKRLRWYLNHWYFRDEFTN